MKKIKVLLVTINYPAPEDLDGTNKIIYNLLKDNISSSIDCLSLYKSEGKEKLQGLTIFSLIFNKKKKIQNILSLRDWFLNGKSRISLPKKYAQLLATEILNKHNEYDIIHLCTLTVASVIHLLPKEILNKMILTSIDCYSLYRRRKMEKEKKVFYSLFEKVEYQRAVNFERDIYSQVKRVIFVSNIDAHYAEKNLGCQMSFTIPLGVDIDYFSSLSSSTTLQEGIIFTGNFSYPPNKTAASFLIDRVHPLLSTPNNKITSMTLAGKNPDREVKIRNGIEVTGYVNDLRPFMKKSLIYASPIFFGAGMKNKILEAFSMGMICLCSAISIEGIEAIDGIHYIEINSEDPNTWAKKIDHVLLHLDEFQDMKSSARKLVKERYSWKYAQESYYNLYQSL